MAEAIELPRTLHDRLIATIRGRLPTKSFGYLVSDRGPYSPQDVVVFDANVRNDQPWKGEFESYGRYFVDHPDAGFVATPAESWRRQKQIWACGMSEVGVFHSHQRHPGNFSQIDYDMHVRRFEGLWHLIVSMRNPALPQLRAFAVVQGRVREVPVRVVPDDVPAVPAAPDHGAAGGSTKDRAIARSRDLLRLGADGRPFCGDARGVVGAIDGLVATGDDGAIAQLLVHGFLRGSADRYEDAVAPLMREVGPARFQMGTDATERRHFSGESPRHPVSLSAFEVSSLIVTNEAFGLLDPARLDVAWRDRRTPVTSVTWFDARLFAMWVGCRLPTEAEWEYACGVGGDGEWCCEDEDKLARYAWYSANAGAEPEVVGTREPNSLGLFDLHGNVWEWCRDAYDQDSYASAATIDPVWASAGREDADRVCRGGSHHALSEMCRTRYRFHEPPAFSAADLGFRLARDRPSGAVMPGRPWSG